MKLLSGRLGKDGDDIISLFDELHLSSAKEAQKVMDAYYDGEENMTLTAKALLERHVSR